MSSNDAVVVFVWMLMRRMRRENGGGGGDHKGFVLQTIDMRGLGIRGLDPNLFGNASVMVAAHVLKADETLIVLALAVGRAVRYVVLCSTILGGRSAYAYAKGQLRPPDADQGTKAKKRYASLPRIAKMSKSNTISRASSS